MKYFLAVLLVSLALCQLPISNRTTLPDHPPSPRLEELTTGLADQHLLVELLRQAFQQSLEMKMFQHEVTSALVSLGDALSLTRADVRNLQTEMTSSTEAVQSKVERLQTRVDDLSAGLANEMGDLRAVLAVKMGDLRAGLAGKMTDLTGDVGRIQGQLTAMRDEVRLISQQKLTWQNHTYSDMYHSDFAVDGIYNLVDDIDGHNPSSITGANMNQPNTMLILDLGATFKIHSVRIWNRRDGGKAYMPGVYVYAGNTLLGAITEVKLRYIFETHGDVYTRKVIFNQSRATYLSFIEVQVFGSGPYPSEDI